MRKARGIKEVLRNESKHRFKHTSIGSGKNVRIKNKHKKRSKKLQGNGRPAYRGQGR